MATPILKGLPEVDRALEKLTLIEQQGILTKGLRGAGHIIADDAGERAPRDEGQLAESMVVRMDRDNTGDAVIAKIGPDKDSYYGLFQEIGTAHHAPQPFLIPAFEAKQDEALEKAARIIAIALGL